METSLKAKVAGAIVQSRTQAVVNDYSHLLLAVLNTLPVAARTLAETYIDNKELFIEIQTKLAPVFKDLSEKLVERVQAKLPEDEAEQLSQNLNVSIAKLASIMEAYADLDAEIK